jgi:hypothetical protein
MRPHMNSRRGIRFAVHRGQRYVAHLHQHQVGYAGALGWHDDRDGLVFSRVFAADCKKYGIDWRIDLTHEAWEMRGDPEINRQVKISNDSLGRERVAAIELCDPVEDDSIRDRLEGFTSIRLRPPIIFQQRAGAVVAWR